jgi:hypothetical protein
MRPRAKVVMPVACGTAFSVVPRSSSRVRMKLTRVGGVAEIVRALAKKPGAALPYVQARAKPVGGFRRRRDGRGRVERDLGDAAERIRDDGRFQRALTLVGDVRVARAAARRIADRRAPIGARLGDIHGAGPDHLTRHPLDDRRHALAWNRARHEHDLPLVASQHPPASHGLHDIEIELITSVWHQSGPRPKATGLRRCCCTRVFDVAKHSGFS